MSHVVHRGFINHMIIWPLSRLDASRYQDDACGFGEKRIHHLQPNAIHMDVEIQSQLILSSMVIVVTETENTKNRIIIGAVPFF